MYLPKRSDLFSDKWQAWGKGQFVTRLIFSATLHGEDGELGNFLVVPSLYWCINPSEPAKSWYEMPAARLYRIGEIEPMTSHSDLYRRFTASKWDEPSLAKFSYHPPHSWNGRKTFDAGLLSKTTVTPRILRKLEDAGILYQTSPHVGSRIVDGIYWDVEAAIEKRGHTPHNAHIHDWVANTDFTGLQREFIDEALFQDHIPVEQLKKF